MNNPTIKDLIKFVLTNRKNKSFVDLSIGQIGYVIAGCLSTKTLYYTITNDKISGMILALIDKENKTLFVIENLSMTVTNVKLFFKRCKIDFPDYSIETMRHGRYIKYNLPHLDQKLS